MQGNFPRRLYVFRIMRQYLGADPVFQGGHDASPVGVILGVGGENELHVEGQAHLEPTDLHIPFFQDIEQGNLYARLQVRKLVDGKNAAVGPGYHPEMDHAVVGIRQLEIRRLDGVYIPDQVGHRHIGGGQFFVEPLRTVQPGYFGGIALLFDAFAGISRKRPEGVVVQFRTCHFRDPFVKQVYHQPCQAGLGLPPEPQQVDVVA